MFKLNLLHRPEYFGFYIEDDGPSNHWSDETGKESNKKGFATIENGVLIRVLSEFSKIPIDIEYNATELAISQPSRWDRIVECSIKVRREKILFTSATDARPMGAIDVEKGRFRIRIYWGGQQSGKDDGSTADFYLVQIWPSDDLSTAIVKGPEVWPRPEQPWEREVRLERNGEGTS